MWGALVVGALVAVPVLPKGSWGQPWRDALGKVGLRQQWRMYAPTPPRGHAAMEVLGIDASGEAFDLLETAQTRKGWGTSWGWERGRDDLWRHIVGKISADKLDDRRTWYLRYVCVREARAGTPLATVEMWRVHRKIRPPEAVAQGKATYAKARRERVAVISCQTRAVQMMLDRVESAAGAP